MAQRTFRLSPAEEIVKSFPNNSDAVPPLLTPQLRNGHSSSSLEERPVRTGLVLHLFQFAVCCVVWGDTREDLEPWGLRCRTQQQRHIGTQGRLRASSQQTGKRGRPDEDNEDEVRTSRCDRHVRREGPPPGSRDGRRSVGVGSGDLVVSPSPALAARPFGESRHQGVQLQVRPRGRAAKVNELVQCPLRAAGKRTGPLSGALLDAGASIQPLAPVTPVCNSDDAAPSS